MMNNQQQSNALQRRVGASVVPNGEIPYGYGPYSTVSPYGPYPPPPPPPPYPGCGCPPFPPLPYPPIIFDDRVVVPPRRRRRNIHVTANVAAQTVPGGSTQVLLLAGQVSNTDGAFVSGNSLSLPVRGTYLINLNVTVSRSNSSPSGTVLFTLQGGNGATIAGGTVASGNTEVFSGSTTVHVNHRDAFISVLVSNLTSGSGPVSILGGTLSAQLIERDFVGRGDRFIDEEVII